MAVNRDLNVFSFNHRNTTLEERDALSMSADEARQFVASWRLAYRSEAAVLSTCNRTEFYVFATPGESIWTHVLEQLTALRPQLAHALPTPARHVGSAAARHLFRVAASLESLALGENQILAQVKDVHDQVLHVPGKSPALDRLFNYAIRAGKLVRHETALCEGSVSISAAAVDLTAKIFGSFQDSHILIVGAGETARITAQHLRSAGASHFCVVNRGEERGQSLAGELGGRFRPIHELHQALQATDIAVFATGANGHIVTRESLKPVMRARSHRSLFLMDISNPRNVDPAVTRLDGVFLYNIDDLNAVVGTNLSARQREIPEAERIVEHMVSEWTGWLDSMQVKPTIATLARYFDEVRQQELQRHHGRLSEAERAMLEDFSRGLVKKLLHPPIHYLRTAVETNTLRHEDLNLVWALYNLTIEEEQADEI